MLEELLVLILGLLGLSMGSFLGALTWRMPRGMSILTGRSQCPRCHKVIAWYDNIPLLSYILLGGRCRNCHQAISIRYPLIEAATAIGFVSIWYSTPVAVPYLLLVFSLLVAIFVIDFEHRIIPDELVFAGFAGTSIYLLMTNSLLWVNLLTGFLLADFLLLVHLITFGRGMGLGDVKLALFLGTFFSWPLGLIWIFASFLIGGAFGFTLILLGRAGLRQKIAFGPFLVVAASVTFVFAEKILLFFK